MAKVSIQLLTWNGAKYIPYLFGSLKEQTFQGSELIILDNASEDNTVKLMEEHTPEGWNVIFEQNEKNVGFAPGHNQLFHMGTGEYVLVLNQDIFLEPDAIEKLVQYLDEHQGVGVVSPRLMKWNVAYMHEDGENMEADYEQIFTPIIDALGLKIYKNRRVVEQYTQERWEHIKDQFGGDLPVFGVPATCGLYRREALEKVAYDGKEIFDPMGVSYKEDIDLAFRLQSAGYKAAVSLDSVAYHDRSSLAPVTTSNKAAVENKKKQPPHVRYHSYKNHLMLLYKNEYWQNVLLDLPAILWYELKKFLWNLLFDRQALAGVKEIWIHRKELKHKRAWNKSIRSVHWKAIRTWW